MDGRSAYIMELLIKYICTSSEELCHVIQRLQRLLVEEVGLVDLGSPHEAIELHNTHAKCRVRNYLRKFRNRI